VNFETPYDLEDNNTHWMPKARPSSEEPGAVVPHAGICEGGIEQSMSLPQSWASNEAEFWAEGTKRPRHSS
jgi:hypothetical protein